MNKSRFTESQIIQALKANESGRSVEDICRELGIAHGVAFPFSGKATLTLIRQLPASGINIATPAFPNGNGYP